MMFVVFFFFFFLNFNNDRAGFRIWTLLWFDLQNFVGKMGLLLTWLYAQVKPLPAGCRLTVCYHNLLSPVAKHLSESYYRPCSTWVQAVFARLTAISSSSSLVIRELYSVCWITPISKNSRVSDRTTTSSRSGVHSSYHCFTSSPWWKCWCLEK